MDNKEKIARYQKQIEETPVKIQTTDSWLNELICEMSLDFFRSPLSAPRKL